MVFIILGVFNVMVASFLQNTERASKFSDRERRCLLMMERKLVAKKTQQLLTMIMQLQRPRRSKFGTSGENGKAADLEISRAAWHRMLGDPKICEWLEDMGCD